MMRFLSVLLALLAAAPAAAQRPAIFGVVDPGSFVDGNATRFIGCHDGRRFVPGPCRVEGVAPGAVLPALDSLGRTSEVRIRAVHPLTGDLYQAPYWADASLAAGGAAEAPLLFWTGGAAVQRLAPRDVVLEDTVMALLRAAAGRLLGRAASARAEDERPSAVRHGQARAVMIDGEDRVVVHWPATLVHADGGDERASFTFLWSPSERRVVHGTFGHPAWAPVGPDLVLAVKPLLFFRVGMADRVYFLGRRDGAWEHIGFGIFDLRTGETVAPSL